MVNRTNLLVEDKITVSPGKNVPSMIWTVVCIYQTMVLKPETRNLLKRKKQFSQYYRY